MMPLLIGAAIACGLTGIISYALYARAHMKADEAAEARYLRVHYISLFLLFAVGVVVMFYMGAYSD
jgi:uncharacterized membrane protein